MAKAVVDQATLSCSQGTGSQELHVTTDVPLFVDNNRVATIFDHIANINILPFGQCKLDPQKQCKPNFPGPWQGGFANLLVSSSLNPTFSDTAKLQCAIGGVVSVSSPGQDALELDEANHLLDSAILESDSEHNATGIAAGLVAFGATVLAVDAAAAPGEAAAGPLGWLAAAGAATVGGIAIGSGKLLGGGHEHSGSDHSQPIIVHARASKKSPKETASDIPSWAGHTPAYQAARQAKKDGETPNSEQAAEDAMREQYGENWRDENTSRRQREKKKIKKSIDRGSP